MDKSNSTSLLTVEKSKHCCSLILKRNGQMIVFLKHSWYSFHCSTSSAQLRLAGMCHRSVRVGRGLWRSSGPAPSGDCASSWVWHIGTLACDEGSWDFSSHKLRWAPKIHLPAFTKHSSAPAACKCCVLPTIGVKLCES